MRGRCTRRMRKKSQKIGGGRLDQADNNNFVPVCTVSLVRNVGCSDHDFSCFEILDVLAYTRGGGEALGLAQQLTMSQKQTTNNEMFQLATIQKYAGKY